MTRRKAIKRDLRRFHNGRPFYTSTEEVPPWFGRKLRNQGWDFKPAHRGVQAEGGHWVPPGYKTIPVGGPHGKHYA